MKTVRAIKIDVIKQEVYDCAIVPDINGLQTGVESDTVQYVGVKIPGCNLYIDEKGLQQQTELPYFIFDKGTNFETVPLVGHGLIVKESVEITDCKLEVEEIAKRVSFSSKN